MKRKSITQSLLRRQRNNDDLYKNKKTEEGFVPCSLSIVPAACCNIRKPTPPWNDMSEERHTERANSCPVKAMLSTSEFSDLVNILMKSYKVTVLFSINVTVDQVSIVRLFVIFLMKYRHFKPFVVVILELMLIYCRCKFTAAELIKWHCSDKEYFSFRFLSTNYAQNVSHNI